MLMQQLPAQSHRSAAIRSDAFAPRQVTGQEQWRRAAREVFERSGSVPIAS